MNILLINHYAGSPYHGMEYRPYYLSKEWVKVGHKVKILAASHSHVRIHQPEVTDSVQSEAIDGIRYCWYRTPAYVENGIGRVKNIFAFQWHLWMNGNKIADEFKPDVVIASSTYPMDIWAAHRIAKRANARLIYEVHDLWPLSPVELGGMPRWHPFIIWCQWAEDYAYQHANKVVSMLPKASPYMVSRGMRLNKFHYIPNGINVDDWENMQPLPDNIQLELRRIRQKGLPVVCYTGTYGLANALDALLDAAKLAESKFEVVLVGTGSESGRLLQRVEVEKISNVTLLSAIPKTSISTFLRAIDIAFIGLQPQPLFRFGISPNKLMDYMMAGKPIVMAIRSGNDPVSEADCGVTVTPGDPIAIRNGILQLVGMTAEERQKMGENGQSFILSEQTYPVLAQHFLQVMSIGDRC